MRLNIKFISACLVAASPLVMGGACIAVNLSSGGSYSRPTDEQFRYYANNNIGFYNANACASSGNSGNCGENAKEIYWSALSAKFTTVQAAGILGNLMNEGGFNPVAVESCDQYNPFNFIAKTWDAAKGWSWDTYYNNSGKTSGVGAFAITSHRAEYLHFVNDEAPELLKYFQHPEEYSFGVGCQTGEPPLGGADNNGDALMKKIGAEDYRRLVDVEIKWIIEHEIPESPFFKMEEFATKTTPGDAAEYWSMEFERCNGCLSAGTAENRERRLAADKAFDEFKDFVCSDGTGGIYKGTTYQLTDTELRGLIDIAMCENSCNDSAVKDMLSQMPNLYEQKVKDGAISQSESLVHYITRPTGGGGGWYAAYNCYGQNKSGGDKYMDAARDILVKGNRTLPPQVYQFANGNTFDVDGGIGDDAARSRSGGVPVGTTVHDGADGSIWYFWRFAGEPEDKCGDPLGYPDPNNPPSGSSTAGSSGTTSDGATTSSGSTSEVAKGPITLIGDSISVMSEDQLKEKFPDAFMTMVGSRHSTTPGDCSTDDAEGGLGILRTLVAGTGSVAVQHSYSAAHSCEMIAVDESSLTNDIVWELGTNANGMDTEEHRFANLNTIYGLVGKNRNLYLVTPYSKTSSHELIDDVAEAYRDFANAHDNVYVIEWNQAVRDKTDTYLSADGYHPNAEGSKLLADLISQGSSSTGVCAVGSTGDNFKWWSQADTELNNEDSSLAGCGCGPTSFAMLATGLLGTEVTPVDVAKKAREQGIWPCSAPGNFAAVMAPLYGLEYEGIEASSAQDAADKVTQYLKEGWMVQTSGNNCSDAYTPLHSESCYGHVIGIRGITADGKWLVANSGLNGQKQTLEDSFDPQQYFVNDPDWEYGLRLDAIRGKGGTAGSSADCLNSCGNGGSTVSGLVSGGMTLEQAEQFMQEYINESETDLVNKGWIPSVSCKGGSMSNCVSYVQYFLYKHTSKGMPLPNARDVVPTLLSAGFKNGGTTPRAYAIFSTGDGVTMCGSSLCGHTGVVLGIDKDNDKIIIGEAGCSSPMEWTGAHEYSLSKYTDGSYTYAYTDDFLQGVK